MKKILLTLTAAAFMFPLWYAPNICTGDKCFRTSADGYAIDSTRVEDARSTAKLKYCKVVTQYQAMYQ